MTNSEAQPRKSFFNHEHVTKLTEITRTRAKKDSPEELEAKLAVKKLKRQRHNHKSRRTNRILIARMKNSKQFSQPMAHEANRRRFGKAVSKAFVGDGLSCKWSIHPEYFSDYTPILVFVHAVSYVYRASIICLGKFDLRWSTYTRWIKLAWQGQVVDVIGESARHQS